MGRVLMCSVSPQAYPFNRSYKFDLLIPACPPGQTFSSAWIEDGMDHKIVYQGLKKEDREDIPVTIPAMDIARDLLVNGELERQGVWICNSGQPVDAEIEAAQEKRIRWLMWCVEDGDKIFAKHGNSGLDKIEDYKKRAARELGEDRPWVLSRVRTKIQCEGCGTRAESLSDGSSPAYCPNCKSVINEKKAADMEAKSVRVKESAVPAERPKTRKQEPV